MRYTVIWLPVAKRQLAEIWVASSDRSEVARASHDVDRELTDDPDHKGQPFFGDRLLRVLPLEVMYRVRPDDRLVDIMSLIELE